MNKSYPMLIVSVYELFLRRKKYTGVGQKVSVVLV